MIHVLHNFTLEYNWNLTLLEKELAVRKSLYRLKKSGQNWAYNMNDQRKSELTKMVKILKNWHCLAVTLEKNAEIAERLNINHTNAKIVQIVMLAIMEVVCLVEVIALIGASAVIPSKIVSN
jgi:hypothetical protein